MERRKHWHGGNSAKERDQAPESEKEEEWGGRTLKKHWAQFIFGVFDGER